MSFFFNDTATTEIYTLSLHDALPISELRQGRNRRLGRASGTEKVVRLVRGIGSCAWVPGSSSCSQQRGSDRKSTRLNSSHSQISYAVFCLKKKKNHKQQTQCPICRTR